MRRLAEEMRSGIGKRVKAAERKVVEAARRGASGGLSAQAEGRIRAALLEIAELPASPIDESIPRAMQLMDEREGGPVESSSPALAKEEERTD
jgi:hypothetical protein